MAINPITALPAAPQRSDAPATFASKADAWLAALAAFITEMNTSIGQINQKVTASASQVIGSNTNAVSGTLYALTASLTLTLPASPAAGAFVMVANLSGTTTAVIGRNGSKIEGLTEDMIINVVGAVFTLVYTGATNGWEIVE